MARCQPMMGLALKLHTSCMCNSGATNRQLRFQVLVHEGSKVGVWGARLTHEAALALASDLTRRGYFARIARR